MNTIDRAGLFQQKEEFAIGRLGVTSPVVGPFNFSHDVALVVELHDFQDAAVLLENVVEFVGGGSAAGAVRQDDPAGGHLLNQPFDGFHRDEPVRDRIAPEFLSVRRGVRGQLHAQHVSEPIGCFEVDVPFSGHKA